MGWSTRQSSAREAWKLAADQHGVIARRQLLELGFTVRAIEHRLAKGRLHVVRRGVYAVGRPQLTRYGRWMVALLACGPHAVLSHESAAAMWRIRNAEEAEIEVSLPAQTGRRRHGVRIHRRRELAPGDLAIRHNIPLTSPVRTLMDLAVRLEPDSLEAAINEANKRELIEPDSLHLALDSYVGQPGVGKLRAVLDT